jgi:hypothetical protein
MEHLWSRAGATGGKRAQIEWPQERLEQAKNGKEGVDGSSPSEGFARFAGFCGPLPIEESSSSSRGNVAAREPTAATPWYGDEVERGRRWRA